MVNEQQEMHLLIYANLDANQACSSNGCQERRKGQVKQSGRESAPHKQDGTEITWYTSRGKIGGKKIDRSFFFEKASKQKERAQLK